MIKYDVDYYHNLLRIHTHTAKEICDIRWKFLEQLDFASRWPAVLDYGCGVGWFAAFRPGFVREEDMDTFDIMPVPQTGIRHDRYDIVTLWDVLEHIPDFTQLESILAKTDYVALSIPIKPTVVAWNEWKHFKPGEHLQYYDIDLLRALFKIYGFSLIINEQPECPPRVDIYSLIFQKDV